MPNILCPKCDSTLAIDDSSVGQMVQCGSCQNVFKAAVAPPSKADDEDERPSKRKSKRRYEDDEEDERPSKRRSSKRDDDDDDEDEDRPRKKKGRKHYHDEDDEIDDAIAPTGSNGMATASLVLGIIALVIDLPFFGGTVIGTACPCCLGLTGLPFLIGHALAAILAIIGLILGLLAMKKPGGKGAWMAGLILSSITLLLAILALILSILGVAAWTATMPTQPTQNWNQPVQPQPRPVPPRRG